MATTEQAKGFRICRYATGQSAGRMAHLHCDGEDCDYTVDVALLPGRRDAREADALDHMAGHVARRHTP